MRPRGRSSVCIPTACGQRSGPVATERREQPTPSSSRAHPGHERPGAGPALPRGCRRKRGRPTIMPIPKEAWAPALSPSERFSVTERPRSAVSEDRRLISSPVRVLSKKATSCLRTEENREARSRFTMRCPARANRGRVSEGPHAGHGGGPRSSPLRLQPRRLGCCPVDPGDTPLGPGSWAGSCQKRAFFSLSHSAWRRRRGCRDRVNTT